MINPMKFVGVVGKILEHVPFAISMVERFLGKGGVHVKKLAASKEIIEFAKELLDNDPADEWAEVQGLDYDMLFAALEDEEQFVKHIMAVNDSVVSLVNYINSKAPQE